MSDEYSWIKTLKNIVKKEIQKSKPSSFFIGVVEKTEPLLIRKNQKLTVSAEFLLLTNAVKEVKKEITIDGEKKQVMFHNALKKGEQVLVLQNNGGQEFIVIEKVGEA